MVPGGWSLPCVHMWVYVCVFVYVYILVCICMYVCVSGLRRFHYFVEFYMSGLVLEARVRVVYMQSMAFFHP